MLNKLLTIIALTACSIFSNKDFAQVPNLGTAVNFALFSSNGAVTNTGISHVTGNVGTNNGSSTGFGNVNGGMHDGDGTSAQCMTDLHTVYLFLNAATATHFPAPLLGNGQTLDAGIYSISGASTMNGVLNLDAQSDPNAVFIIKIQGSFSTNAASKVILLNGALACNVFWKVEGMVSMATGTSMKGTVIANNAAISIQIGDTLEGRALTTDGSLTVNGVVVYTPTGCGSTLLTGPPAPALASTACYALFSSDGAVSNSGITHVTGDVGTNVGLTTGYDTSMVNGKVHTIPDASTAQCAADLHHVYTYLDTLHPDIQLLYPAQFGNGLELTPHTYLLNAATVFTGSVYLNAEGNTDAVFVFQMNGALSTSTYANVVLLNGAQAKNVFWKIEGAVTLNNYSTFNGTIVCNNGALGAINTGVNINGRLLTTNGALTTTAITADIPSGCGVSTGVSPVEAQDESVSIYPNPFGSTINITINGSLQSGDLRVVIYNMLGQDMITANVAGQQTTVDTRSLQAGIYFCKIISNGEVIRTQRLVSVK